MLEQFQFYIAIIIIIILLIMVANKTKIAYPILLVVAGLIISLMPGVPSVKIEPELIFIIFLPPLLYESAWSISWRELWKWRRIISSFAFIVVFLTALMVAFAANAFIPGFTLALGFLLGGIVSPPDAVSTGAILKFVKVPKRMSSILEGESLLNDASSLIILRFALIAVATGQFIWYEAALNFSWMLIGGVGTGLLVGWIFMKIHKLLPTDETMDIVLTIVTPYVMYILAEEMHSSGVLSVVAGGLLLSKNRHLFLSSSSRLRGVNVWESIVFILNGLVFFLIGLDLPEITSGLKEVNFMSAIGYGLLITLVLIAVRILASYGAVLVTMFMKNFITVADEKSPGLTAPLLIGWAGMRGVVSLAAALSIPVYLDNGNEFPQRNLILFITFVVILTTLLVQGLTLPLLIKKIKLPAFDEYMNKPDDSQTALKKELYNQSLHYLLSNYPNEVQESIILKQLAEKWKSKLQEDSEITFPQNIKFVYLKILEQQRIWLLNYSETAQFDEEIIKKHLHQIDLEEEKIRFL